jgi:hypothetical protein
MSRVQQKLEEQCASNASGLPHFERFSGHRRNLTALVTRARPSAPEPRLCVLGAGNAFDLDLDALLLSFAEVHLVDIDAAALGRARARASAALAPRLFAHAPLELSGMFHELERWDAQHTAPQELLNAPARGAQAIAASLPGPFEVVASTCLLTQLQLTLLGVLGESHQMFGVLRELVTVTHLHALAALTAPSGNAVLVTDLCDDSAFPAGRPRDEADLAPLMQQLLDTGHVIYSAHPEVFKMTLQDDPVLARAFATGENSVPWLWQNGPGRRFLVYGLTLPRR